MKIILNNKKIKYLLAIVLIVVGVFVFAQARTTKAAWYSGTWGYRKQISINKDKVAGGANLSNFVMLFSVTDPDLKYTDFGGKVGKIDATDMLFTSSDGTTKLNHEIEYYSSTTGQIVAWVQVPTVSASADTQLFVYYGNAAAADQQAVTSTWESTYKAVWHLGQTATSTSKYILDSTSNANNASSTGAFYPVPFSAGKIGGSQDFDGTDDYVSAADAASLDIASSYTVSAWVNADVLITGDPGQWNSIITKGDGTEAAGNDHNYLLGYNGSSGFGTVNRWLFVLENSSGTNCNLVGSTAAIAGNWYFVNGVFDDTGNTMYIYVNGELQNTLTCNLTVNTNARPVRIGDDEHGAGVGFNGRIDEARIYAATRSAGWVATEYNNQYSPSTFYSYGTSEIQVRTNAGNAITSTSTAPVGWYSTSWSYRKKVTIDKSKISGTSNLSNFPFLISVIDPDLRDTGSGGLMGNSSGYDILVTSSDGTTKLDHEIEKYTSSTGELVLWVEVPTLSVSADTDLYIYFGNSGASDQQNINGVWDSNYKLVWHLPNGSSLSANDSTSNANNGTVSSATATSGKAGGGANFSGTSQEITRANTSSLGVGAGDSTISAWIYINAYASAAAVYDKGASGTRDYAFFVTSETSGHIAYGNSGGSSWTGTGFTTGMWHYLTVTQTGGTATVYLDGVQNFTKAVIVAANTAASLSLGGNPSTGGSYWNGKIDEFRISGSVRTTAWMITEFNDQYNPGAFYGYGGLERYGVNSRSSTSGSATPAVKARGGVKFR